jgi:hypothetical protein
VHAKQTIRFAIYTLLLINALPIKEKQNSGIASSLGIEVHADIENIVESQQIEAAIDVGIRQPINLARK